MLIERGDAYIARLHDAGIRGARFTRQGLGIAFDADAQQRAFAKIRELGWYAKFQPEVAGIAETYETLNTLDMPVVLDHMGRPDASQGLQARNVQVIVELLKRGNFWVMLSLSEKISKAGPPWDDVIPIARAFIDAAPDRCIWGSDWPHPVSTRQPPNEADLMELMYRFAPDADMQKKILVDNPAKLFGFDR